MVKARIICRLFPTEDEEKVVAAIRVFFPEARLERRGEYIYGETETLDTFLDAVGREGIAARALSVMKRGKKHSTITFPISREAATAGRISFGTEGEFPPIWVEVVEGVEDFIAALRALAGLE